MFPLLKGGSKLPAPASESTLAPAERDLLERRFCFAE